MTISTLELIRINLARRKAGLKVLTPAEAFEALQNKPADNGAPDLDYLLDFDRAVVIDPMSGDATITEDEGESK